MFDFLIELVGLFCAAVASRLFWLRRHEYQPTEGTGLSALAKARLGLDAVMVAAWLALIVYAKWVMWWWIALIIIVAFTTAAWVGIQERNRDQLEPAGAFFSALPILAAIYLWLG
mgnify:CR=1 FL=1